MSKKAQNGLITDRSMYITELPPLLNKIVVTVCVCVCVSAVFRIGLLSGAVGRHDVLDETDADSTARLALMEAPLKEPCRSSTIHAPHLPEDCCACLCLGSGAETTAKQKSQQASGGRLACGARL